MLVTLLIPCHNEAEAVGPLFDALAGLPTLLGSGRFPEAVFIDDGSTDGTAEQLQAAANRLWFPARVIALEPNRGLGAALREGAPFAVGEAVATYDADRPYPLEDLPRMLDALEAGAEVVTASPWHPEGTAEGVPASRSFLSRTVSTLYRLRLGSRAQGLHTFTCGYRVWRRERLLRCLPRRDGFVATAEMLLRALRQGAPAAEIPSRLRARTEGRSKMRALRVALSHLGLLLGGGSEPP